MREEIKIGLIALAQTALGTVGTLAVLVAVLYVAYAYFDGWQILEAIAVEIALLVFIFHLYRWIRYPGLFQSKPPRRLLSEVLLSIVLIYSIPLIAILARLYMAHLLGLDKVGFKLGLEFKFKKRDLVQISADAPAHPGDVGRISRIWVAAENTISQKPLRIGEVIYAVRCADGLVDVPEQYLVLHLPSRSRRI